MKIFRLFSGFVFIIHGFISAQTSVEILSTTSNQACAGDLINYTMENINTDDIPLPDDIDGTEFSGVEYAWDVVEGEVFDSDDANFSVSHQTAGIIWDNECITGKVIAKGRVKYINTSGVIAYVNLTPDTLEVKIHKAPDELTISCATTVVECDEEIVLTFTASDDCMADYTWTYPPEWEPISGWGTSVFKIKTDGLTGGSVQVEASFPLYSSFNCQNVSSSVFTVTRDCPSNKAYLFPTSTLPEHTAVDDHIIVDPLIGTVKVQPSDVVRFKAGNYINIKPGFIAYANSKFTAKIGPCNSCTAFRVGMFDEEEAVNDDINVSSILLCPNPSNGVFDITFKGEQLTEEPYLLNIHDLNGKLILNRNIEWGQESVQIDLSAYPKGMYVVTLQTSNTTYQEKIVVE